jgi:hypothetical protein
MTQRRTIWLAATLLVAYVSLCPRSLAAAQPKDLDKIPKRVLDTLNAKFPGAAIDKWTKEREHGKTIYDIEFTAAGRKAEADIAEDGAIQNFETQFDAEQLPKAVTDAVARKYPKSRMKEVLEVTEIKNKKEVPGGFEIVIETAGNKEVELTIARNGKILENSGVRPSRP